MPMQRIMKSECKQPGMLSEIPKINFQGNKNSTLEDLAVLKRSPDLVNNVKIGQDQLLLIMKHILFYGG